MLTDQHWKTGSPSPLTPWQKYVIFYAKNCAFSCGLVGNVVNGKNAFRLF